MPDISKWNIVNINNQDNTNEINCSSDKSFSEKLNSNNSSKIFSSNEELKNYNNHNGNFINNIFKADTFSDQYEKEIDYYENFYN